MLIVRSLAIIAAASALGAQTAPRELPLKYSGPPTVPAITAGDLMTRLYKYADDSMGGRVVGTEYNIKATAYIEREVRRLGLTPAGDHGGYFQDLPIVSRSVDSAGSALIVNGRTFGFGSDFEASTSGRAREVTIPNAWFFGVAADTANLPSVDAVRGKYLVLLPFRPAPGFNGEAFVATEGFKAYQRVMGAALGVMFVEDSVRGRSRDRYFRPTGITIDRDYDAPYSVGITPAVAQAMFGKPLSDLKRGDVAAPVTIRLAVHDTPKPLGRNVVAVLRGSDPKLRGEYIAIGAHNDHIQAQPAVDHDSLKVFNAIALAQGADATPRMPTADEWTRINAMVDSLHRLHGGARVDSISNGADDDGSGTVSVLELAEAFATAKVKPKRSILFIWHAGEERGMWGSEYFTGHPTVPRDSIVAEINLDMIGRGAASDVTGTSKDGTLLRGGDKYVQLVGSRRLSTELGNLVEAVNRDPRYQFRLDYGLDADGHPQNIYCRSDHAMYAAWGIPVVFFTTGGHADYHQVTDEPQYIRYEHMALLDRMIYDLAWRLANLDHRIVVDKAHSPDPHAACQQ